MASPEIESAPKLDLPPSSGFKVPTEPKVYSSYPETSPLGVLEAPLRKIESVGRSAVGLVLDLPARTMDLIFGNKLWP